MNFDPEILAIGVVWLHIRANLYKSLLCSHLKRPGAYFKALEEWFTSYRFGQSFAKIQNPEERNVTYLLQMPFHIFDPRQPFL